ncbi:MULTISPECIES: rhodanese-like domain-containing protein [Deefgea]|uniref:Rhodanese-like domain-containing protein n=1 Tax=Deefgea chitinilytica TaxID=570276 RepID=A0ABS2C7J3_9NEIS|nr:MULTISPECIES: rhodanese-like domain-containing protein [Deefgea]MBM5570124.1 rhodanese-like domain-containing protein [Deefgea chitinilytica]MBM9887353.1 rhodanese-like domain-containing protein [Deefgea sp. CFH1-16]
MSQFNQILENARGRAVSKGLAYAGEVTPAEAWALVQAVPSAKIVDVRTHAEWQWVGVVPGAELIEWKSYPGMVANPHFVTQLKAAVDSEAIVLFLCRSGARSHDAAALAAQHGYTAAMNILEGFEGDKDAAGHRGSKNGWQAAGLPWTQG